MMSEVARNVAHMGRARRYTDEELAAAVASATSWRGTLRALGLTATSATAIRSVRQYADQLCLDYSHFRGRRRWTDHQLRMAVASAHTWNDVAIALPNVDVSEVVLLKGHVARLGIDAGHLKRSQGSRASGHDPSIRNLDRAGSLLAAAWFTLCGCDVSWPLEPSRYDLIVSTRSGIRRVQVKTTRTRAGRTWKVFLSTTRGTRRTYDPDEIDDFFIIDGDMNYYLIPVSAVGGLHALHLSAYGTYRQSREPATTGDGSVESANI